MSKCNLPKSMDNTLYFQVLSEKRSHLTEDRGEREDLVEFEDLTDPDGSSTSKQSLASTSKHKQGKY